MAINKLTRADGAAFVHATTTAGFLRMEEKIGSIERGKLADLAVLDRDYFAVPDVEIRRSRSVLTIVDGKSSTMRGFCKYGNFSQGVFQ